MNFENATSETNLGAGPSGLLHADPSSQILLPAQSSRATLETFIKHESQSKLSIITNLNTNNNEMKYEKFRGDNT